MGSRFSTAQVKKAIGLSTPFLKGLTRSTDGKPPLFTPASPATSSGKKDFYSYADLMVLKVIWHLRSLKLSRDWIDVILIAADEWRKEQGSKSPFHEELSEQNKKDLEFLVRLRLISVPAKTWKNFFPKQEAQILIEVSPIEQLSKEAASRGGGGAALVTPIFYTSTKHSLSRLSLDFSGRLRSKFAWEMGDIEELVELSIHVSRLRKELDERISELK